MWHHLDIYTVHLPRASSDPQAGAEFVREGFSVWAFLFTGFWTLYHRLWLETGLIVAVNILIGLWEKKHMLSSPAAASLSLGISLICGFFGQDWRRRKLERRGFIIADIVAEENLPRAQLRFFTRA